MNHRTKTLVPMAGDLLKPRHIQGCDEWEKLKLSHKRQAEYYNRCAKDPQQLKDGGKVRMKPFTKGRKEWQEATVTHRLDERSYEVENPAGTYQCNRVYLRPTPCRSPSSGPTPERSEQVPLLVPQTPRQTPHTLCVHQKSVEVPQPIASQETLPPQPSGDTPRSNDRSRFGRTLRKPVRLKDYVWTVHAVQRHLLCRFTVCITHKDYQHRFKEQCLDGRLFQLTVTGM